MAVKIERLAYFNITTAVTSVDFTSLDGNTDGKYFLAGKIVNGAGADTYIGLRFNGDTGTNYGRQSGYGSNTAIGGAQAANDRMYISPLPLLNGSVSFFECEIFAKSGFIRTAISRVCGAVITTTVADISFTSFSWNNTTDNITSMTIVLSNANGIGVGSLIELFRKATV